MTFPSAGSWLEFDEVQGNRKTVPWISRDAANASRERDRECQKREAIAMRTTISSVPAAADTPGNSAETDPKYT